LRPDKRIQRGYRNAQNMSSQIGVLGDLGIVAAAVTGGRNLCIPCALGALVSSPVSKKRLPLRNKYLAAAIAAVGWSARWCAPLPVVHLPHCILIASTPYWERRSPVRRLRRSSILRRHRRRRLDRTARRSAKPTDNGLGGVDPFGRTPSLLCRPIKIPGRARAGCSRESETRPDIARPARRPIRPARSRRC
jgi:hypothetical protein